MNTSILSIYGSHDASATFLDKNNKLRILELERFSDIRYAMFSKKFDDWPICVKEKVREDFLLHIKSEIKEQPTTIIFGSLIDKDLELLRKIFPTCENYEQFDAHHLSHAYGSYFQSPFKDALVFTVDGGGSDLGAYTTTKVWNTY